MYFAMPQDPFSDPPQEMSVEDLIIGVEEGDPNCLEWMGCHIQPAFPPKPLETTAICKTCKQELPLVQFYTDKRKRNGHMSVCCVCTNQKRLIRYHNGKKTVRSRRASL